MTYPATLRYTKDHEWIEVKGELGTVGLTDHAQSQLGDVVFVELPKVGTKLEAGKPLGTVESTKAVFEIFAPASGEVSEVNEDLANAPEKINQDPHGAGWLVKVRLLGRDEVAGLMDAKEYESYLSGQGANS
ncbi:MAG TPA: glycine cleavage system protein GcvH [Candidatus Acidoferrales bacterium]|nr:glycine cleavage system protein GcvH [Candidatus Acidoferrales bacterium]